MGFDNVNNCNNGKFNEFTDAMLTSTPKKNKSPSELTNRIRNLATINDRIKNINYKHFNDTEN